MLFRICFFIGCVRVVFVGGIVDFVGMYDWYF